MGTDISFRNEIWPDGQAKYVPHGLRIIGSLPEHVEIPAERLRHALPPLVTLGSPAPASSLPPPPPTNFFTRR